MENEAINLAKGLDKSVLILLVCVLILVVGALGAIVYSQMKAIFKGINESIKNTNQSVNLLIKGFERHNTILEFHDKDIADLKKRRK